MPMEWFLCLPPETQAFYIASAEVRAEEREKSSKKTKPKEKKNQRTLAKPEPKQQTSDGGERTMTSAEFAEMFKQMKGGT